MFLENELLYGQHFDVPQLDDYILPIGKARTVRPGKDVTLVSDSLGVGVSRQAAEELAAEGIDAEVIDLLSIKPMDTETMAASVAKTGRCVVVAEAPRTCSVTAEIIARLNETCFEYLLAPIKRINGYDIHFPFFQVEQHYLPDSDTVVAAARETVAWE